MMNRQDQDEYSKAFNAPTDDAPEGAESESASVTLNEDTEAPVGDPMTDAAMAGEAPAEEVSTEEVPAEEVAAEEPPETPEDEQRRKSWEGRLKKLEAELKAREAALAERESPQTLAEGGEVMGGGVPGAADVPASEEEKKKLGLKEKYEQAMSKTPDGMVFNAVRDMLADGGQPGKLDEGAGDGTVTLPDAEAYADGGEVGVDAIKAEALELAGNPEKLAAVLKNMVADYGRDFVVGAVALAAPLIDAKAEGYINDVNGNLESLVSEVQQAFSSMHRSAISDAHEDFEELVDGEEFQGWLAGLDEADRTKAEKVVESGSSGQVIKLLGQFKEHLKAASEPKERTPEDVWAEDAASSVRSSAPLKIPTRAPESESDEYKRAFDEA